jgi:hypothetical protein
MSSERWAACLPCHQAGIATGEWFTHPQAITPDDVCLTSEHHAVVVFDGHDLTRILNRGEGTPTEKILAAAVLEALDLDGADPEAYRRWIAHTGRPFGPASTAGFVDAYRGKFPDHGAYTRHYCEQVGEIDPDAIWPHNCIDWQAAAQEMFSGPRYALTAKDGWLYVFARDR